MKLTICVVVILCTFLSVINCEFDCPNIVTRRKWGAQPATGIDYQILPLKFVFIHHTSGHPCTSVEQCSFFVLLSQTFNIEALKLCDIRYKYVFVLCLPKKK